MPYCPKDKKIVLEVVYKYMYKLKNFYKLCQGSWWGKLNIFYQIFPENKQQSTVDKYGGQSSNLITWSLLNFIIIGLGLFGSQPHFRLFILKRNGEMLVTVQVCSGYCPPSSSQLFFLVSTELMDLWESAMMLLTSSASLSEQVSYDRAESGCKNNWIQLLALRTTVSVTPLPATMQKLTNFFLLNRFDLFLRSSRRCPPRLEWLSERLSRKLR